MPIFNGFEGECFTFKGTPNAFYNLISDDYLQVNSHIDLYDNIDQIGIKFGSPQVFMEFNAITGKVYVDNKLLYQRSYFPIGLRSFEGYAEIRFQFETNTFNAPALQNQGEFVSCVFVEAGKYHFYIIRNKKTQYFYTFLATIRNNAVRPHGIIGQTADFDRKPRLSEPNSLQGEGIIEGYHLDYKTNNLWDDSFKYNRFKKEKIKL